MLAAIWRLEKNKAAKYYQTALMILRTFAWQLPYVALYSFTYSVNKRNDILI